jgi:hypothetical protein
MFNRYEEAIEDLELGIEVFRALGRKQKGTEEKRREWAERVYNAIKFLYGSLHTEILSIYLGGMPLYPRKWLINSLEEDLRIAKRRVDRGVF